jgi:hypothetical protein
LDSQEQQRVVAPPGAGRTVGAGQERIHLGAGQEVDERAVEAFGRDGEHTLDDRGVFGMPKRGIAE